MAYKKRSERKRSMGGKAVSGNQYNAQGSPEERSEKAKSDGFKKGGMVEGKAGKSHLAKRARGGALTGHNSSRSPMSSAHKITPPGNSKGSPGEQASSTD
jgi:hypothetical protein